MMKNKKHPAHEAESKGGGLLHLMRIETDKQLETALRSLGVKKEQKTTIESLWQEGKRA